ncbi:MULTISPECIES: hypothetical protein [Herbaspirillum]|uniref:hypothetical protein n=1 Tax=Herbaspirillum TaxID=963 RepID=UPI001065FEC6|nr:hypothetical protein [Herbaspirillum sp. 1130]MBP1316606.1 regulator of protease activity HflC (stomatin/prohibitin superfamily) [Herbaspirillum sp. 1130]
MYPDPKRVRKHRHMLSLDDYEQAIVESLAHYQGEATATILRQLALRQAAEILASGNGESVAHATF